MKKRAFKTNKKALIFVALFSISLGFIFPADRGESGKFFSTDLIVKSLIIAIIGGVIVTLVSYIQYKKSKNDNK